MSLQLIQHTDTGRFHDAVTDHLHDRYEAECCAMVGLVGRMAKGYSPASVDQRDRPLLWTIQDGEKIELVAVQTLKTTMLTTRASEDAVTLLADSLAEKDWDGSSLLGIVPSVETLTSRYAAASGRTRSLVIQLRTFDLRHVIPPTPVAGAMRACDVNDREQLARFIEGFHSTVTEPSDEDSLTRAARMIREGRAFFWVDKVPVAMAAWAGPTRNGIRINSVYTPPEFRGRGYASNLVAHLTQHLLDGGRKYCFLHTDLANPTSNSIYQKIGYRMVSDSQRWTFGDNAPS